MGWEEMFSGGDWLNMFKSKPYDDYNPRYNDPVTPDITSMQMPSQGAVPGGNDFLSLYDQLQQRRNQSDPSNYYNPNDPEVQDYKNAAFAKPESEKMLQDYINSRPDEDKMKPSIWRSLGAGLLGVMTGLRDPSAGAKLAGDIASSPYNEAMDDWKAKGANITTQARLLDAANTRGINARKYGLDLKYRSKVQAQKDQVAGERGDAGLTRGATAAELAKTKEENDREEFKKTLAVREEAQKAAAEARDQAYQLQRDRLELMRERLNQANQSKPSTYDKQANDPAEIMKQKAASTSLAMQDIKANPDARRVFGNIISAMDEALANKRDPMEVLNDPEVEPNSEVLIQFKRLLDMKTKGYLAGR